jgi:hypothetical protein
MKIVRRGRWRGWVVNGLPGKNEREKIKGTLHEGACAANHTDTVLHNLGFT